MLFKRLRYHFAQLKVQRTFYGRVQTFASVNDICEPIDISGRVIDNPLYKRRRQTKTQFYT